jgi:hypothetical protein
MALTFYSDPVKAFEELSTAIPKGQRFVQEGFDYDGKPTRHLEDIYPGVPLFDANGADSWEVGQGDLSNCMILSDLAAMASSSNPYTIENIIYPNTPNEFSLYFVSIADGLERKWFPVSGLVPVGNSGKPIFARGVDGTTLWPPLIEKASATIRGNKYASLHASVAQAPSHYWIPSINVICKTFEEILAATQMGGYGRVGFDERRDASGALITTPGIVLSHAFGLVSALQVGEHRLIRLSNPWGGGCDFESPLYADDAPFWAENGLLNKVSETKKGGEFYLSWDEFLAVRGSLWANQMRIPLPHPQLPHAIAFDATFDDTTATISDWPSVKALRPLNQGRRITLAEPTDIAIATSWQPGGSGPRHSYTYVTDGTGSTELMDRGYGWWGGDGFTRKTLPAGTYEITPAVVGPAKTRGTVQYIVLSSKPIE